MSKVNIVITTVEQATPSVLAWLEHTPETAMIIIGDEPGPHSFDERANFYAFDEQAKLPFRLASTLPSRHYSRKNLGYLIAMQNGVSTIYETDNDNAPLPRWNTNKRSRNTFQTCQNSSWTNIYLHYIDNEVIWPRGLPLDAIKSSPIIGEAVERDSYILQSLANGSPDVDAIWRLTLDKDICFNPTTEPIFLEKYCWSPFNSQSTWWFKEAFPLMYLPSHCPFRMTDIWRGFIAQRCLWEMNSGLSFCSAEVYQDRNEHDLMSDFEDEVPGYLQNHQIIELLSTLNLDGNSAVKNLILCYKQLIKHSIFPEKELLLVRDWVEDAGQFT